MTLICYKEKKFNQATLDTIEKANEILSTYAAAGQKVSLRQLYYRFVANALIPNEEKQYKRLSAIISDGRLAGLISWDAIEDRDRNARVPYIQPDETEALRGVEYGYAPDLWDGQDYYVEVWVEKMALINIAEKAANRYDVPYMGCRGYMSQSEQWKGSQRFIEQQEMGRQGILIHLGDHDPSGIDMTRDNDDRLRMFGADVEIRRIALNYDQILRYNPPPNPTKMTDSRKDGYIAQFGGECWELDSLEPGVVEDLIKKEVEDILDVDLFNEKYEEAEQNRSRLRWIGDNPLEVLDYAGTRLEDEGGDHDY